MCQLKSSNIVHIHNRKISSNALHADAVHAACDFRLGGGTAWAQQGGGRRGGRPPFFLPGGVALPLISS